MYVGALNTVGRYIVNMTRGQEASSGGNSNNPSENVPDAILTLTKNVLGQNVTNSIEPMIKRIGTVDIRGDDPAIYTTIVPIINQLPTLDAKKKKKKQKVKRKDQPLKKPEALVVVTTTENCKLKEQSLFMYEIFEI